MRASIRSALSRLPQDEDVQLLALAGLASLASFHLQATSQGQPGLQPILLPAVEEPQRGGSRGPQAQAQEGGKGRVAQESNQPLPTAFLSMLLRLILTHFSR